MAACLRVHPPRRQAKIYKFKVNVFDDITLGVVALVFNINMVVDKNIVQLQIIIYKPTLMNDFQDI